MRQSQIKPMHNSQDRPLEVPAGLLSSSFTQDCSREEQEPVSVSGMA